jgi:hypothetical protein
MARSLATSQSQIAQVVLTALGVIACAALAGFWATRILAGNAFPIPPRVGANASLALADPLERLESSAALFGSRRPGGPSPNVQALGLIADANGEGGAIIAIAGQPPRAVRVGDRIDGRLITAIDARGVTLEGSASRDSVPLIEHPHPQPLSQTSLGNVPLPPQAPPGYGGTPAVGLNGEHGASMAIPPLDTEQPPQ